MLLVDAGDWEQNLKETQALSTEGSLAKLLQAKDRHCALEQEGETLQQQA